MEFVSGIELVSGMELGSGMDQGQEGSWGQELNCVRNESGSGLELGS